MTNRGVAIALRRDQTAQAIEREMAIAWARLATAQVRHPCPRRVTVLKPVGVRLHLLAIGA